MRDPALWARLEAFALDDPAASLPFSARLARDNGWSHAFARRVIGEYKRFLYLAAVAGHEITPSEEVDEAWHLHLLYTRSYWGELCPHVLGRPLHHGPTKGGDKEAVRWDGAYAATLAAYRAEFSAEPPADIWPPAAIRFKPSGAKRLVDTSRWWLIRRPSPAFARRMSAFAAALLAIVTVTWEASAAAPSGFAGVSSGWTWAGAAFVAMFTAGALFIRSWEQKNGCGADPEEIAARKARRGGDGDTSGGDGGDSGCGGGCGGD